MARKSPKRLSLPVKRAIALTGPACDRLRALNESYGLGNNCLLTVLLQRPDDVADPAALDRGYREFIAEYGAPAAPNKTTGIAE